ncbi:hypothetical protein QUF80_11465 [Desulfococcaceae bacterium HSG8]|nr:hypothetical protein [Desulfococcaceae bacterium HSG8]
MIAYEFETEIRDGMIRLPKDFKGKQEKFRIIVIQEEKKHDEVRQALLNAPVWSDADVQDFNDAISKGYKNWTLEAL